MENFDAIERYESTEVELGYMCHRGLLGPPAVTHQVVEI